MNLNKKVGILLDNGLTPDFVMALNENSINALYERMSKKETKEGIEKVTKVTTKITPDTAKKGATIEMPAGKTAVNIQQKPDGSIEIGEDVESDLDWVMKGRTQQPKQVGPDTDDGFDDYDDGTGQIDEKFESKAQQGLFWARCNKCKSENCKWCKMAKEFSKSTSKKQYKTMPEKKHPEKTVKYKKKTTTKKETKEDFSFGDYNEKIASVAANSLKSGMMRHKPMPIFSESELEKKFEKIIENNLLPSMKKRDLLILIESEIKRKKGLSEDNHKKGSMSTETEIKPPKTKQPPKTDNPFKIKPGIKTPPKAKKDFNGEIEEASMSGTETAPTIKPPKEKEKEKAPGRENPFAPKPGVKPKPKAKSDDSVPQWLSFGSLTDKY
jgi:hypothetical protein